MFVTANGSSIDLYDDVDESLLVSPTKTEERNEADGKRAERQRPWHRHHQSASPPSDAESFSRTPAKSTFGASLYNLDELNELETPARKSGPFAHPRADPSRPCCSGGAAADAKIQLRRPFDKSKSKRSQSLVPIPVSCLASLSNWEEDWENQQANWDQFEDWDIDSSSETSGDDTALGAQGYVNRMRESIESYFSSHSSKSSEDKCDDASDDLHEREARSCPGDAIGHLNRETITLDVHQAASTTRENKYPDPNEGGRADLEELGKHAFQLCLSPILPHSSPHCSSASGHMDGDEKLSFRKDAAADTSDQRRPSSLDDLPPHLRYFRNLRSLETHTGGINPHLNTRFLDPLRDATGQREREPTGERQCHKSCQIQPRCPEEREARRGRESRKEPVDQAEHSSERRSFATSSDPSRPVENPRLSASRKDFALRIRPQQNKADAEKKSIKTLKATERPYIKRGGVRCRGNGYDKPIARAGRRHQEAIDLQGMPLAIICRWGYSFEAETRERKCQGIRSNIQPTSSRASFVQLGEKRALSPEEAKRDAAASTANRPGTIRSVQFEEVHMRVAIISESSPCSTSRHS